MHIPRFRRPGSLVVRGAVVCTALAGALGACSPGAVEIDEADGLSDAERSACRALVEDLPEELVDLSSREVEPADALGAAWGDPAIVVRCGVAMPDDFDEVSPCEEVNGVGWFVRPSEFEDAGADLTAYTIGWEPAVSLSVPAEQRQDAANVAGALAQVSTTVKQHLELVQPCV